MVWSGLQVPPSARGGIVTIGNFDGVHRGHQVMLSVLSQQAKQQSRPVVVVTFDPHPINVLKPDVCLPRLSTIATRTALLKQHGAAEIVVLPVDTELLSMQPEDFFRVVVQGQLEAVGIVEGPDFHFGKDRRGNTTILSELCANSNVGLTIIPAVSQAGTLISSTYIRRLLSEGQVAAAVNLFGHTYTISGMVTRGAGRGRELGIPTANLTDVPEMLPRNGVYAAVCDVKNQRYPVAVSIGPNPTFQENCPKVECHIIDFSGDLYETTLTVDLISEIRDLKPFADADELVRQIAEDITVSRQMFETAK